MVKSSEPFVLKLVDRFVRPFLNKNLNYTQVREILKLKLILDSRRVNLNANAKAAAKKLDKEPKRSMLFMSIIYMVLGIFIASVQMMKNPFGVNILAFAMLMFMLLSVYISEYSAVLLDTTEKTFYGALPIGQNEINTAKNIHIAYYIGTIAFSMMLPSVIVAAITHGALYTLLFAVIFMVVTVFCLHLAGTLYYLLLKVFSGERLKDILSGVQVFMTIALVVSYQIIPRILNFTEFSQVEMTFSPVMFIIPSAWFSGIFGIIFGATSPWYYYALTGVGIVVVILLESVYKKKVVPEFEGELDKLTETSKENKSLSVFSNLMCKVLSKDKQENAFMKLVLIQVSRNREIKLKLYPQLANVIIIPVIILFSQLSRNNGFGELIASIRENHPYIAVLYSVGLTSSVIYTLIGQSENKESLLFYQVLPIENLSKCIRAGVKVVLFRYLTPLFVVLSLIFVAICGIKVLPDLAVAYLSFIFVTSLMIRLTAWVLPFSTETTVNNAGYNMLMFFMNMIIAGGFALAHVFVITTLPLKLAGIGITLVLNLIMWKWFMNKKYVIHRY